jgi:hypothetical protein
MRRACWSAITRFAVWPTGEANRRVLTDTRGLLLMEVLVD